jgi:2-dehydropantoate 2-reductase
MKILVFGAGAIGTIYGYFLAKAGNDVTHYVRPNRAEQLKGGLAVRIQDGRDEKHVQEIQDNYVIRTITSLNGTSYDLILVSIKHGSLDGAAQVLRDSAVTGDILFFNGLWKDYTSIDSYVARERYLWGYPVAGGNIDYESRTLQGAILDHVVLGETDGRSTERLSRIVELFGGAGIKSELPRDVLHWIWIHMAINAGVISTCLKVGSAPAFMGSARALGEGILTMREGLKVVQARGVDLKDYHDEVRMYYLPVLFSGLLFKFYFRQNLLSRKIMELHNNMDDLYELCSDVYHTAKELGIDTPRLDAKARYFRR